MKEGSFYNNEYVNYFAEIGHTESETDRRLNEIFEKLFTKGTKECIYGEDIHGGYLIDTGNTDVRTEGQSYGMMMAVQMDRQDLFDKIWSWTVKFMLHDDNKEYDGYFAWSCQLDGKRNAQGPAPDGEEYFAMALFFASARWGDKEYPYDYSNRAKEILRHCIHQSEITGNTGHPMWNGDNHLIKFTPEAEWTDPSYHLPHFYELFALKANEEDRPFWKKAASESRKYLTKAIHPVTGLSPEYSEYDGTPKVSRWNSGSTFYSDAYRVALNIAIDSQWFGKSEYYSAVADKIQKFFNPAILLDNLMDYSIDGEPTERKALHPIGLASTVAACSVCNPNTTEAETRLKWIKRFWDMPLRDDKRRYYDNDLYFFSFLILSGRYRIYL